jgi:hypothetical protein
MKLITNHGREGRNKGFIPSEFLLKSGSDPRKPLKRPSIQLAIQILILTHICHTMSDDGNNMAGILTDKDIFRFIAKDSSASSVFVNDEVLARQREMAERFNSSLFEDILRRRQ